MALFENMLILVLVAVGLLHVSRRLNIPYPTMLALSGVLVATLPWTPVIEIDPQLALALFIAPALFDAAYDFSPRALKSNWKPLLALAAFAVVITTAAVAWVGMALAGLPLAAAIALGAIVAPPDAAAATAVLARFSLPRRTIAVLKGESLFNDALALLILGAAISLSSQAEVSRHQLSMILIAAPGGIVLGIGFALVYVRIAPSFAGTLGSRLLEFVATFGVWVIAERLHLSAILCIVAFAMGVARYFPERQSARDRVHSYAVWEAAVFVLNVLAFLLMGLQARAILIGLNAAEAWQALAFAGVVLATVVFVRIAWVLLFNRAMYRGTRMASGPDVPSFAQACIVSWCGMRGVVTLAAALYLPTDFPGRDLIVLSSLAVVLGTLIGQGLTLGPLIRFLGVQPDASFDVEVATTRAALLDAAIDRLSGETGAAAVHLRDIYRAKRAAVAPDDNRRPAGDVDQLRRSALDEMRTALAGIRRAGRIEDDVFQIIQEELDWAELAASSPGQLQLEET